MVSTRINGRGSFLDATHVRVENTSGQADFEAPIVIIATGTKPAGSTTVPINGRTIMNSDQILEMPNIPRTLIVVGGGRHRRGVRLACSAILGVRVILVEKRPRLLGVRGPGNHRGALLPPAWDHVLRHHALE